MKSDELKVVALSKALELAQATLGRGMTTDANQIVSDASVFEKFLNNTEPASD